MHLSSYGKREWVTMLVIGVMLCAAAGLMGWWAALVVVVLATLALLSFFRDPERKTPSQRGVMVSPADGRVSSVHQLDRFDPLGEAAVCVRIFLSVADVHVNRSPCHGEVASIEHKPGKYLNAIKPESAEVNESTLVVLLHPLRKKPIAAVRQVAGLIARTIVCATKPGEILQRGQRFGMIKFGSTTELYIPLSLQPQVLVQRGQYVYGGLTVLANVSTGEEPKAQPANPQASAQQTRETPPTNAEPGTPTEASPTDAPTAQTLFG